MKVIVCLDDKNGMLFNNRRQSRDRVLIERLVEMTSGSALWMHPYSQELFDCLSNGIRVDALFLEKAGQGEHCFLENVDVTPYAAAIEELIVFRWNRVYPADLHFPVELLDNFRKKDEVLTFPGSSHDKITLEVYAK